MDVEHWYLRLALSTSRETIMEKQTSQIRMERRFSVLPLKLICNYLQLLAIYQTSMSEYSPIQK
jgi:hypothetical protein